ncbi:restriction endonuclease subunit S [Gluconacetobacter entanii]|uniref:restriction endonuclease subunit S n=1 Tax=Gluconacetobacter entanii TaxID=108528 RepID=UPI001C934396|nr:restriction endonuclease subunit S [Gluconacetobacter entanii]MBY4640175.1 restriction endonuclease subunit S [Gluconacetobacter entanii]MCW4579313.1 restriction endonuclease subunit S [Gluconacetobacter entanii]MCW4582702.1 restriction endonuclease subunit S [Gluconacetobacter entanii]MCW4586096.1 restriction endonuclease subunit S [Gluconacetobacter entanii]
MLPEGWNKRSVAEVCRSVSVGVVIKPSQYYVSAREGVKAFRSANVKEGQINNSDWVYFSHKGHNENKKSELKSGDVLVVRTGYPGTACVVSPEYAGCNAIDIVIARPDIQKIIPTYLCLFTNSEYGKSQVANLQGGMAQKHLNVGAYQQVEIPLPSLPEQKKIAAILSTWDRAIEGTEKLLANSQQQKKALMQQLLTGKKRLPGFTGVWETHRLSDIAKLGTGNTAPQESHYFSESGHDFLRVSDLGSSTGRWAPVSRDKITLQAIDDHRMSPAPSGATLFTKSGASLLLNQRAQITYDTYIVGHLGYAKAKKGYCDNYLFYILSEIDFSKIASGTSLPALKISDLGKTVLHIPSLSEQQAIAAVLSTADAEITVLESDLSRLRQEKKALMQQLLTGKRRVTVD